MIRVNEDCEQDNPCNGNKCPKHSECITSWHNYTCKCHTGNYCQKICFVPKFVVLPIFSFHI